MKIKNWLEDIEAYNDLKELGEIRNLVYMELLWVGPDGEVYCFDTGEEKDLAGIVHSLHANPNWYFQYNSDFKVSHNM